VIPDEVHDRLGLASDHVFDGVGLANPLVVEDVVEDVVADGVGLGCVGDGLGALMRTPA
jgi:hypothetical protein